MSLLCCNKVFFTLTSLGVRPARETFTGHKRFVSEINLTHVSLKTFSNVKSKIPIQLLNF